ncbi:MAG TPA: DNA translocase FtsK 4TM domain-containing protein [Candidatus Aveggerthella excrementigallinarum]|nr:DNA translocase FtsK 4TM domain-containing protein [Candidatus Aveggerthella excrementigallinarum]
MTRGSTQNAKGGKQAAKHQKSTPARQQARKRTSRAARAEEEQRARLLDDRSRRDIVGVVIAVLAIVLFVIVVMPSDALITHLLSTGLHSALGIGCYILPFVLLVVGAAFLYRFERPNASARIAIGLALVYLAILVLMALSSPGAAENAQMVFNEFTLPERGGYVGAGVAWVGLTLFGQVVSTVVMVGVLIAGLVVVGFSLSGVVEHVRGLLVPSDDLDGDDVTALDSPPYARVKLKRDHAPVQHARAKRTPPAVDEAAETRALDDAAATRTLDDTAAEEPLDRAATRVLATSAPKSFDEPKAEPARAITRRLGAKHRSEAKSAPLPARRREVPPSATPHPSEGFTLPSMDILNVSADEEADRESEASLAETGALLQETLADFGIHAEVVGWVAGPTVTLFKVDLPAGVRVSRVTALTDDIALALAAPGVRIFAPIPGTNYVGIEVPNRVRQNVLLGDVLPGAKGGPLEIAIGKDVEGQLIISDLAKMPHLLIGGTTGSGKSVSINAMIMSILMRATPSEVRFIMIDPKRVEFTPYNGIPHLYVPVVTEAKEAASALSWGVAEMERRLKVFSKVGARNISQYNAKVQKAHADAEAAAAAGKGDGKDALEGAEVPADLEKELPYIVIIIDELADLMMNVGKEVEFSISRIAQLARAAGIHLIVATQRPSTNVVTGLIKANITNRIAFNVASGIDSRVILDTPGAENLIGLGDLLFSKPEYAKPQRIQGCFVSEDEINEVVEALKAQGEPEYHQEILSTNLITLGTQAPDGSGGSCEADDPLLWEAADIVVSSGLGSTSNIQRRLKVGYSRAGRIMDMLEEKGVVGPPNGSKPREVLVDAMELETLKAFEAHDDDSEV